MGSVRRSRISRSSTWVANSSFHLFVGAALMQWGVVDITEVPDFNKVSPVPFDGERR